jgi:hypothetical protein
MFNIRNGQGVVVVVFFSLFMKRCVLLCLLEYQTMDKSWGGVRMNPLGTSATNWLIVPAPDDR